MTTPLIPSTRRSAVWGLALLPTAILGLLGCSEPPSAPLVETPGLAAAHDADAANLAGTVAFTYGPWGVGSDIARIGIDGTGLQVLTSTPEPEMMGGWSWDGSSFLFTRGHGPDEFQVWRARPDGSGATQLTSGPGVRLAPNESPDGSRILYMQSADLSGGGADIFVAGADGSNPVNLTNHPATDGCPKFSPDGSKILFASSRGGGLDVWVMDADGSNPTQITAVKGTELCPSWSPDGGRIAWGQVGNRNPGIWVAHADGTGATRIYGQGFAAQPTWSPDGEWLVFHRFHAGALNLYRIRTDGADLARVTQGRPESLNPAWRP